MHGGSYILMGVPGTELDAPTAAIIREVQPAGFILFGRNIRTAPQLRALLDDLSGEVRHRPVVTIDQEGGRVSRLKECGAEPPSAKQLREHGDPELIERHGRLTGDLLRLFGFNLDLCPVLDLSYAGDEDNSLKNRTWGVTADEVIRQAGAFNSRSCGGAAFSACGKHFPGYSRAAVDPHHELPVVARTRAELEAEEWRPFRALLHEMDSMMVGHANYPALDDERRSLLALPHGLSTACCARNGVIAAPSSAMIWTWAPSSVITDWAESVTRAVEAGNDLVLLCHRRSSSRKRARALEKVSTTRAAEAEKQLAAFHAALQPPHDFSIEAHAALDAQVMQLRIDTLGAEQAAQRSADDGKRSPVETF